MWLTPTTCMDGFSFNPQHPIACDAGAGAGGDFQYRIGYQGTDIAEYRKYIAQFPEVGRGCGCWGGDGVFVLWVVPISCSVAYPQPRNTTV